MDVHPTKNVSIGIDPYPHQKKAGFDKGNLAKVHLMMPACPALASKCPM
jgi:hypothetical protein